MTQQPVNAHPAATAAKNILDVTGLQVDYISAGETFPAVRGVSFSIPHGKIVADPRGTHRLRSAGPQQLAQSADENW